MRRLASSVQRWLIGSPIRLTTPSTPSRAAAGGRSAVGRHGCQLIVGLVSRARSGSRLRPTTSSPRARSASETREPMKPLAPVTSTRIAPTPSFEGSEGARLLGDPRDPIPPRLLDDRRGHGRRDLAIEHARDDVVLAEVLLGDHL